MRRQQRLRFASEILIVTLLLIYFQFLHPSPTYDDGIEWNEFAYFQYVTNSDYLCNSVMLFETLHRFGSKAERLMAVPKQFADREGWVLDLMLRARDEYGVRLKVVDIQNRGGDSTWSQSFTKLLAFNQTQYRRILSLDSDATLLSPLDDLFLLPATPVAMPRAYWLPSSSPNRNELTSSLLLATPSATEYSHLEAAVAIAGERDFDMEILNSIYAKSAMVLPHNPYLMVTGELRNEGNHEAYLGNGKKWDVRQVRKEVKYVHFSDWPMPKPWISPPTDFVHELQPECEEDDCEAREIWLDLYRDFATRRKKICGLDTHKATRRPDGGLALDPHLRTGLLQGHDIT